MADGSDKLNFAILTIRTVDLILSHRPLKVLPDGHPDQLLASVPGEYNSVVWGWGSLDCRWVVECSHFLGQVLGLWGRTDSQGERKAVHWGQGGQHCWQLQGWVRIGIVQGRWGLQQGTWDIPGGQWVLIQGDSCWQTVDFLLVQLDYLDCACWVLQLEVNGISPTGVSSWKNVISWRVYFNRMQRL